MKFFVSQFRPRMTVEEHALLVCLSQIDGCVLDNLQYPNLAERLIDEFLAERLEGEIRLTAAGFKRSQSLQQLLTSDLDDRRFFEAMLLPHSES